MLPILFNYTKDLAITALEAVHISGHRILHVLAPAAFLQQFLKGREIVGFGLNHHGPKGRDLVYKNAVLRNFLHHRHRRLEFCDHVACLARPASEHISDHEHTPSSALAVPQFCSTLNRPVNVFNK